MNAVGVPAMHRIGSGRERFAVPPAIGRVTGALAVDHVRRDRQNRLGMEGVSISWILAQLVHESAYHPGGKVIHAVVVISELRKLSFSFVVGYQASLIANDLHPGVANRREAVRDY